MKSDIILSWLTSLETTTTGITFKPLSLSSLLSLFSLSKQ